MLTWNEEIALVKRAAVAVGHDVQVVERLVHQVTVNGCRESAVWLGSHLGLTVAILQRYGAPILPDGRLDMADGQRGRLTQALYRALQEMFGA